MFISLCICSDSFIGTYIDISIMKKINIKVETVNIKAIPSRMLKEGATKIMDPKAVELKCYWCEDSAKALAQLIKQWVDEAVIKKVIQDAVMWNEEECTCHPTRTSECPVHGYSDLLSKRY